MPARRSGRSSVLAVALAAAGCREVPSAAADASPPASAGARAIPAQPVELTGVAEEAAARGLRAARALGGPEPRARYLEVREAVAAGAPFWIRRAEVGAEPLLGPQRSLVEAGGSLAALDLALAAGDHAGVARERAQVESGLALIEQEIARNRVPLEAGAQALSAAAYELGLVALEATAAVPEGDDAVRADLRGLLASLAAGAEALARAPTESAAERDRAMTSVRAQVGALRARVLVGPLSDRASFVVATGKLGATIRRLARLAGARVSPPYAPRHAPPAGEEPEVSALTLPAPRRTVAGPARGSVAEIGRRLFLDPRLSKNRVRSCASCHDPARWFTDGLPAPASLDPASGPLRHTPTLLYTSIHAAQMWDGRLLTAESQALDVIHARAEMGLTSEELSRELSRVPEYREALAGADGAVDPDQVSRALVAFEIEALVPDDAPIDRFARGDEGALSAGERAGLDVFASKGRCARCHVPPLYGGSRPRDFAVPVFAVVGVPRGPAVRALDDDRGRAARTRRPADERAFKTPTLRNIGRTAPYFHHGGFARLEDAIDLYDKGGGRGLGLDVPNQDPDVRPLKLTPAETRALLLFLRVSLLDATPPASLVAPPP